MLTVSISRTGGFLRKNVYRVGKSDLKQGTYLASRTDDID